jgi:hypothetical protein
MHVATKRTSAVRLFTTLFSSRQCTAADILHAVVDGCRRQLQHIAARIADPDGVAVFTSKRPMSNIPTVKYQTSAGSGPRPLSMERLKRLMSIPAVGPPAGKPLLCRERLGGMLKFYYARAA